MTVTNGKLFGKWASQGGPEGGRARAGTNDLVRGRAHAHHIAIVTARRHLREVRTIPQTILARWRCGAGDRRSERGGPGPEGGGRAGGRAGVEGGARTRLAPTASAPYAVVAWYA